MLLVTLVALYTSRVILKILGVEDFGIYNIVGSVVLFCAFFNSALRNATYRYLAFDIGTGNESNICRTYSMAMNVHVILALGILILLEIVGSYFVNHHLVIPDERMMAANVVFQLSLITFLISIIQTPLQSLIIANEHMNFYALSSIVEVALKLGMIFLIPFVSIDKLVFYGLIVALVAFVVFLLNLIYCRLYFKQVKYIFFWDKDMFKQFLSYSGWAMLVNGADVSSRQCMSIFFNWFTGLVGNTALGLTNQVSAGISNFVSSFGSAFGPQIIKSYAAGDNIFFMRLVVATSKISGLLFLLIAVPIYINTEYLLELWLGDYPEFVPAMIRAALLYHLMDSLQSPLYEAVHATGNIKTHQILMGSIKFFSIPIMFFAFKMGASAILVILIWSLINVLCSLVRTIYLKYLIGLDIRSYGFMIVRLAILSSVELIILEITKLRVESRLACLIITTLLSFILILAISYIIMDKEERSFIYRVPIIKNILMKFKIHVK